LSIERREFLPYAQDMLAQEDAALAVLGRGSKNVSGTLRFAAPSTFAELYIAPVLPVFQKQHPEIILDLRLSDTQLDLIEGSFDLALRNQRVEDSSLKGRKLADDTRILCAAETYLSANGTPKTTAQLNQHALIAFNDTSPRKLASQTDVKSVFDPKVGKCHLVMNDGASQRAATIAGCGISVNSMWSVAEDLRAGRLTRVLPDYVVDDGVALWLVYPKSNVLTAKVRVFIDFLLETVAPKLDFGT